MFLSLKMRPLIRCRRARARTHARAEAQARRQGATCYVRERSLRYSNKSPLAAKLAKAIESKMSLEDHSLYSPTIPIRSYTAVLVPPSRECTTACAVEGRSGGLRKQVRPSPIDPTRPQPCLSLEQSSSV